MNQTHYYDGHWMEEYLLVKSKFKTNLTFEETCKIIVRKHPRTQDIINLLLYDRENNYDVVNKVSMEELLPLAWQQFSNTELESLLIEQLLDIKNGVCSQGRTTRVFQLLALMI